MVSTYREIERRLKQIDFEALWPGFHPYPFALYTEHEAVMEEERFPTPESFYGNTTILYHGRQIAIWNIEMDPPKSLDLLTADLVHEMFHAFQTERGERRFPDDLALLMAASTSESLAWKIWEQDLLAAGESFPHFCAARLERRKSENTREEEMVETAEGMAQFVEFRALGQLSASALSDALEQCRMRLRDAEQAADARRSGYDSGMYMLWQAAESGLDLYHAIGKEKRTVFELLSEQVMETPRVTPPTENILKIAARLLDERRQRQNAERDAFLQTAYHRAEGPFVICGYDPMNMWRQEDTLFSRGYLALRDRTGEVLSIQGKALLTMEQGSSSKVKTCLIPE